MLDLAAAVKETREKLAVGCASLDPLPAIGGLDTESVEIVASRLGGTRMFQAAGNVGGNAD
jgi:hypothetical protein